MRTEETDGRRKALGEVVGYDYILEEHDGYDFTQFVVSMGGDVLTFRVYGSNGKYSVYAK